MFAPTSAILGVLFFTSSLPNGIQLVELPNKGDLVEIVAGYTEGGLKNLASTKGIKSLLLNAYAAGGQVELIEELDRSGLRMTVPNWALPMVLERLPAFFQDVPQNADTASPFPSDFRSKVEEEIRAALLGSGASPESNYATGDAFVLMSQSIPGSLRDALTAIPKRGPTANREKPIDRLPAERTLRFKSELPAGGVIFASPIPGVFYRQWYLMLMLDRLIRRAVPLPLNTALVPAIRPYYYRIEASVPAGQFPEPVEESLLQELQRLQFVPANPRDLASGRQDALTYLDSNSVREWFASHDIEERRDEGVKWIETMTSDDLRATARDLLISNHVVATWPPKPKQASVSVEPINISAEQPPAPSRMVKAAENAQTEYPTSAFSAHTDPHPEISLPETLASGVSLVTSSRNAVFVSGRSLTRFDHDPTADDMKAFQQYPPERILVLTPSDSKDRARQQWSLFRGSKGGEIGVPKGKVSSGDLPALFVLKTILDLRLIESGWWTEADIRIDAGLGSGFDIRADDEKRIQILDWIKAIATAPPAENYFKWAREVAIHRFEFAQPDLQALTWERDRQGSIQDLETISPQHVQDVARIYF